MLRSVAPRLLRALAIVVLVGGALVVTGGLLLRIDAVSTAVVRSLAERFAPEGITVAADRVPALGVRGSMLVGLMVDDPSLGLRIRADTLRIAYRPWRFAWGRVVLDEIEVVGLRVDTELAAASNDTTDRATARPAGDADDVEAAAWSVLIGRVVVRPGGEPTAAGPEPPRPDQGPMGERETAAAFRVRRVAARIQDLRLSPGFGAESWSLDLRFAPADRPEGWGTLSARGDLRDSELRLDTLSLSSPRSRVAGRLRLALDSTLTRPGGVDWRLEAAPLALADLEGLVPVPGVLAGDSLRLESWSETEGDSAVVRLDAATSVGANLTATVRWARTGSRVGLRAEGRVSALDPRRYLGPDVPFGSTSGTVAARGTVELGEEGIGGLESSVAADLASPEAEARLDARWVRTVGQGTRDSLGVELRRIRWGEDVDAEGRLEAYREGAALAWRVDLRPRAGGQLTGSGRLERLGAEPGPRWSADLRLDALAEPRSGAAVSGRITGEGAGAALPSHLDVALGPSQVAGWTLDTLGVNWSGGGDGGSIRGWAEGAAGRIELDAEAVLGPEGGRFEILGLTLDSAGWGGPAPEPTDDETRDPWAGTRVSGRAGGSVAWRGPLTEASDPRRWSGALDAVLLPATGSEPAAPVDSVQVAVQLEAGVLDGRLRAELPGEGSAGLRLRGSTDPPLRLEVSEGRFQALDLSRVLGERVDGAPPTALNGTLAATIDGSVDEGPPTVRGRLNLAASTVREARIRSLDLDFLLAPDSTRGDLRAELGQGTLQGRVHAPGPWTGDRWDLWIDADLPVLGGFFALPDSSVSVAGRLEAGRDPTGTRVDLDLRRLQGWGAQVDTLGLRGRLADATLTLDTLWLRSNVLEADGGGEVPAAVLGLPAALLPEGGSEGAGGRRTLSVTLAVPDSAAPLRVGAARFEVGRGGAELTAVCDGPQCSLSGDVDFATLLLDRWSVQSVEAGIRGSVGPGRSFGSTRAGVLVEGVRGPQVDIRNATFQTHWDGTDAEIVGSALVDDRRNAAVEVRINPEERSLAFRRLDLRFDEDEWTLERPATFRSDSGRVSLDSLVLTSESQRVVAGLAVEEGARVLSVQADSLRLAAFSDLLGRPDLGGFASARLRTRGAGETLLVTAELDATLTDRGEPSHRIHAEAEARGGEFSAEGVVRDPTGRIHVTGVAGGGVPGAAEEEWQAQLELDQLPLNWLGLYAPPDFVEDAGGVVEGEITVTGGSGGIDARGPLRVREGRLSIPLAGIEVKDIEVTAALDGRTLRVDSARATSRGRLALDGSVTVPAGGEPPELDLRIDADDFLASDTRELLAALGGTIRIDGTLEVPRIQGDLRLVEASYRLPSIRGNSRVRQVELTEDDWAILQSRFGIAPPEGDGNGEWLPRNAVLDVDVELGRNLWVRRDANPEMALQFTGEFRATKSSETEALQLQGTVETIQGRSYVEEFGRRFTIESGNVALRGPVDQTRLNVTGEYRVPTSDDQDPVTIRLNVMGWTDDLTLTLSSEPSLANGDIVSYLATGRPASTAFSGGQGGTNLGADLVASRISGSLERYARDEVGLDVLQVRQEGLHGTSLVAGKYVNPRLFLGFRQEVTYQPDEGTSFSDGLASQAEVEYAALDWLVVNIQGGTSAIRFFLEGTYGW